ncbi:hypothetical protein [Sphaerotilus sp.]|uniref:hypothetical protein n=1 Tax=Sphaerotilus sp. TaxID=2093942 RepID=UPI00286DF93E|nr:hypothetical protein [Sphaerotilus sp.]
MQAVADQQIHEQLDSATSAYAGYLIIRRNGAVVAFEPHKIAVAMMKAFLAIRSNPTCRAKPPSFGLLASRLIKWGVNTEQEQVPELLRRHTLPRMKSTPGNGLTQSQAGFRSCGFFSQAKVNGRNAP